MLMKEKDYLLLVGSMMLCLSVLNCFSTNVELYIIPFGLNSVNIFLFKKDAGISTGISVISGLTGAICTGIIIKKTKKYKFIITMEIILSIIIIGIFMFSLWLMLMPLYWICTFLFGLTVYPILPGLIEYAC